MATEKTIFQKVMDREIPSEIIHEDDKCVVIRDLHPRAPVHLLVIPRKPIPTLNDIEPGDAALIGHLFLVAKEVVNGLGHTDYRTVFNCGAKAGQEVFHLHMHVLAGRSLSWPPG